MNEIIIFILLLSLSISIIPDGGFDRSFKQNGEFFSNAYTFNELIQSHRMKRAMSTELKFPWKFPIKFYIADDINTTAVRVGLKRFEKHTCLRFKEECFELGRHQGIRFFRGKGCASSLGKVFENEPQGLSLAYTCDTPGTVQQTMGHALGMLREQRRTDKNDYVRTKLWNVNVTYIGKFMIKNASNTYGVPYDFGSGMHSARDGYSKIPGKDTIVPLDNSFLRTMGQIEFSFNDYKLLNIYYCDHKCPDKLPCKHSGYTDPNNCNRCICPTFYGGRLCEKRRVTQEGCPDAEYFLQDDLVRLSITGIKTCFMYISTSPDYKIKVSVSRGSKMYENPISNLFCPIGKGLEIRHLADRGSTGAMFCGKFAGAATLSESNYTTLKYVGTSDDDRLNLVLTKVPKEVTQL
uniref:Metalloendopeptidase n=1 Tax=Parastrongyloides trichosuri TaxID=131310 RepID=A0A0N5A639_PARTI